MLNTRNYLILLFCFLAFSIANAESLSSAIDENIQTYLPNTDVAIMVVDADTGAVIYDKNSHHRFSPASNTKLFTSAASLYQFDNNFSYTTKVTRDKKLSNHILNGNVYFTFVGDPSLTIKQLQALVLSLKKHGIQRIKGNVVIDTHRFQGPAHSSGTSYDDLGWYYAAPITSVILNENKFTYKIYANKKLGSLVSIKPTNSYGRKLRIRNRVRTVTEAQSKYCDLTIHSNNNNTITLTGCWPITKKYGFERIAVPNPLLLARQIIKQSLKQYHIKFDGRVISGTQPRHATLVAKHHSSTLIPLLSHMLKESDNIYADSFLKTLGAARYRKGSYAQGVRALKDILSKHTQINFDNLYLVDGAGSRYNLISPFQITELLYSLYHDSNKRETFMNALPLSCISGTLRERLCTERLSENVYAKTGTMHDASALSGYLTRDNKKALIFSIMINHVVGGISQAKELEGELVETIARLAA